MTSLDNGVVDERASSPFADMDERKPYRLVPDPRFNINRRYGIYNGAHALRVEWRV